MKKLFLLVLFFTTLPILAQTANDCQDAIIICGNANVSSNANGFGIQELDNTANPCLYEETNSLWLRINIEQGGDLSFVIKPENTDINVDYDFFVFGPTNSCGNFNDPIRCSTTNPRNAGLSNNHTGLRDSETEQNEGPGRLGNSFVATLPVDTGEQYYILVDRPLGDGGFTLEWTGTARLLSPPTINQPDDIEVCPEPTQQEIDLTQQEQQITTATDVTIAHYTSYKDAFDDENQITDPTKFLFEGTTTSIFTRVTNTNGCFEIADFKIKPIVFDTLPILNYILCDDDRNMVETFSLSQIIEDIEISMANSDNFAITLYEEDPNTTPGISPLPGTTFVSGSTTIYARISANLIPDCAITHPVALNIIESPYPETINLVQCDIDEINSTDGITQLNLEQAFIGISGVTITYYKTIADRNTNNPITNPTSYTNTVPFNDTVYYRAVSNICESTGEIAITVNPTNIDTNAISPRIACDDDPLDTTLRASFSIEQIKQEAYPNIDASFYANRDDAALEQNALHGDFRTTATTIYVRLEDNNQCAGVDKIELLIHPLPSIQLENSYYTCTDGEPLTIDAPNGFDTYSWQKIADQSIVEIGNTAQITITQSGLYSLTVGNNYQSNNQNLSCTSSVDFNVSTSNKAIFTDINTSDFSEENTITAVVAGDGDYEFSIDGVTYQEMPFFENIPPGLYTLYARDKNGCGIATEEIAILGYPKFFTPNNDGINDLWQLIGASENLPKNSIEIFDRYGKLVHQMQAKNKGWNGTLNGRPLPASDYWFRINLEGRESIKGHFTLKR